MSAYEKIVVEGSDDVKTLTLMFPAKCEFEIGGNKKLVRKKVEKNERFCGIVDRDFAADDEVNTARTLDSRCVVLQRYCLESYLMEPSYLYEFAKDNNFSHVSDWSSAAMIEQLIIKKAQEMCHYSAANERLYNYGLLLQGTKRNYFAEYPILNEEEVWAELQKRLNDLPSMDEVRDAFKRRSQEIFEACHTLEGVHRWINGKELLRTVIYSEFKKVDRRFTNYSEERFVEELANLSSQNPPAELVDILQAFGVSF